MEEKKDCTEQITVHLTPDEDGVKKDMDLTLTCCLIGPHPGWRHMNPRIQRTIGGDRRTDSEQWSYFVQKLPHSEPIVLNRGINVTAVKCPKCGHGNLLYGERHYEWNCSKCGQKIIYWALGEKKPNPIEKP